MINSDKKIIVFSGKQFSGKDTAAKILMNSLKTFKRIGIADAIKMVYSTKTGISITEIEKNKSLYRQDLIELGNQGRAQDPDYWLNSIIKYEGDTIVSDIRMKHELDLFKSYGAFCVRIEASEKIRAQRGKLTANFDETETQLDNYKDWDYVIYNEGSYEELFENIKKLQSAIEIYFKL